MKNSFWSKSLKKDSLWKLLDSFSYIGPLLMGGLARLFTKDVTIKGQQFRCLLRSQAKDSEVLRAQNGTKWVDRKKITRHFCFQWTKWKLSLFRTTRMLFTAKMTVALLSAILARTWKQTLSHSMNIRMPAVHTTRRIHTRVTSRFYWA